MRIKTILLTVLLLAAPFIALAEDTNALRHKIVLDQKKLVVQENMDLTAEEAAAFWPVFETNQKQLLEVDKRAVLLILAYAASYQTLSEGQSLQLIKEYFEIRKDRLALMEKMVDDAVRILPDKKAFRYMQVEDSLDAVARYELTRDIPLAR